MEQPIETQPVFTQTPVEPEVPKKSYTWLLILVLLALAAGLSFFAWENYRLRSQLTQVQPSPSMFPVPSLQPSPDPTADWQTYTNIKYHYSIKYPKDWKGNSSEPGPGEVDLNKTSRGFIAYPSIYSNSNSAKTSIFIETDDIGNLANPTYEKWLEDRKKPFFKVEEIKNIDLNNIKAVQINGFFDGYGYPAKIKSILFSSFDKQTYFSILIMESVLVEENSPINLILSTFKFTD